MTALLLTVLLSQAPDGGTLTLESLYTACPDAPVAEAVDGGYFLTDARARRQTCQQSACEAFAEPRLNPDPGTPSPGIVLAMGAGGAVLIAIAVGIGYALGHSGH